MRKRAINFRGKKAKFSVRTLKKSLRSGVINESLRKLRGLVTEREATSVHDEEEEVGTEQGPCTFVVQGLTGEEYSTMSLDAIMSPYEFTSKTHSLSTEDLGFFFIHSFIDSFTFLHCRNFLPYTEISQKRVRNSEKKMRKNLINICCCYHVQEAVLEVQGPGHI